MQYFKALTSGLVLLIIGLFFWQNASSFETVLPFTLDLYIREQVRWSHHLYTLLVFSCLVGLIAGVGLMLRPYHSIRRRLLQECQGKEVIPANGTGVSDPPGEAGK